MGLFGKFIDIAQFDYSYKYRWIGFLTCPFYIMRKNLYNNIKKYAPFLKGSVLDFGCGSKPYKKLFVNCDRYVGVDIDNNGHNHINENIDYLYDGRKLPFENNSFDNVFSSEVIEHISNLDDIIIEINRVLKPNGLFFLTTPFVWNENELPNDFARYTSVGLKNLLKKHGFNVLFLKKSSNYFDIIYQMKAEYYRELFSKYNSWVINIIVQLVFIIPQFIKAFIFRKIYRPSWSFYGNNIVLCKKKNRANDEK